MDAGQTLAILLGSAAIGVVGALLGLGGGVLLVPFLTLVLGWDIRTAAGTSLVSLVGTQLSVLPTARKSGLFDEKVAVVLGMGSLVGAAVGAELAGVVPRRTLYLLFGAVMAGMTLSMVVRPTQPPSAPVPKASGSRWRLPTAVASMVAAGVLSGMLGIGGGAMNVAVMHALLQLSLPAAAATSNFLNGIKGLAGIPAYWARGNVPALTAAPAVLGVLWGSSLGARLLVRLRPGMLKAVFVPVVLAVSVQMFLRGLAQ